MVMVSGHKTPSCSHKVVVVNEQSFSLCGNTYEVTKKLHSCRLMSQNTKHIYTHSWTPGRRQNLHGFLSNTGEDTGIFQMGLSITYNFTSSAHDSYANEIRGHGVGATMTDWPANILCRNYVTSFMCVQGQRSQRSSEYGALTDSRRRWCRHRLLNKL